MYRNNMQREVNSRAQKQKITTIMLNALAFCAEQGTWMRVMIHMAVGREAIYAEKCFGNEEDKSNSLKDCRQIWS